MKPKLTLVPPRPKHKQGTCKFEHCDNEVRHSTLGICYRCYSYLLKWRDRAPGAKRERLQQIKSLDERLEYMIIGSEMPKKAKKGKKKDHKS